MIEEYLLKIGIPTIFVVVLMFLFNEYLKDFFAFLAKHIKNVSDGYTWEANPPIKNPKEVKHISEHLKDFSFDIFKGDFVMDNEGRIQTVDGIDVVIQQMQKFILTERNKYAIYSDKYGIEETETIFKIKNRVEFARQCEHIAIQIMESFEEWIEILYGISRKNNCLTIYFKVKGVPNTIECKIPNYRKCKKNKQAVTQ